MFNIVFNEVDGGVRFKLIKFKKVLKKIVDGMLNIIWIIMILEIFGKICLNVIFIFDLFNVNLVRIYFWFFNFIVCVWMICVIGI